MCSVDGYLTRQASHLDPLPYLLYLDTQTHTYDQGTWAYLILHTLLYIYIYLTHCPLDILLNTITITTNNGLIPAALLTIPTHAANKSVSGLVLGCQGAVVSPAWHACTSPCSKQFHGHGHQAVHDPPVCVCICV
jgi:hypothetical protein